MSQTDYSSATFTKRPGALAALIHSGSESAHLWRPEELAAIFKHQLSAPVFVDLGQMSKAGAFNLRRLMDAQGLLLKSFSELFSHPSPPIELLELTKDFAKANMGHAESVLPGEVAGVLYYTSIAVAQVRLGVCISTLAAEDLRRGMVWAKGQAWVDEPSRQILGEALARLVSEAGTEPTAPTP